MCLEDNAFVVEETSIPVSGAEEIEPISISITYNKPSVSLGEEITATYSITGGSGKYNFLDCAWQEFFGGSWALQPSKSFNSSTGSLQYVPNKGTKVRLFISMMDSDGRSKTMFGDEITVIGATEEVEPISIAISYNKSSVNLGEEITATYSITGGNGKYEQIAYYWSEYYNGQWNNNPINYLTSSSGTTNYTPAKGSKVRLWIQAKDTDGRSADFLSSEIPVIYEPINIFITYDRSTVKYGEEITASYSITGGDGNYEQLGYYWSEYVAGTWTTHPASKFSSTSGTISYTPVEGSKVRLSFSTKDDNINIKIIDDSEILVVYEPITISIAYDKAYINKGEDITASYSVTGGNTNYKEIAYYWSEYTDGKWSIPTIQYLTSAAGTIYYTATNGTMIRLWIHAADTNDSIAEVYGNQVPVVEPEFDKKNGLVLDDDGKLRVYKNDQVDINYSGIVEYNGGKFFIAKGEMCSDASGLNLYDGKWYFLSNGQIQIQYTGLVQYDGEWFYITNGVLDSSKNGLVDYDGSKFLVSEGRIRYDVNGLWQNFDGSWYFLANGQVQTQHTGVAEYDGAFFYVRAGKLATDYNGTVNYDGATFRVVGGQLYGKVA